MGQIIAIYRPTVSTFWVGRTHLIDEVCTDVEVFTDVGLRHVFYPETLGPHGAGRQVGHTSAQVDDVSDPVPPDVAHRHIRSAAHVQTSGQLRHLRGPRKRHGH